MRHKLLNKPLLFALIFMLTNISAFAQTQKPITIIVSGTTYSNPDLTSLKNYLKTKTGIAGLKTTFSNSTATLTFTSAKDAGDFWDDIPDEKKSAFNITSIDSKIIKLQSAKNSKTTTATKGDKNCGCDFFPLCKYDGTQSFQGEVWKMINYDGKKIFYHCENGVLKEKTAQYNWDGDFVGYLTFTSLKYTEPQNATWKETVELTGGIKRWYNHTIIKKDSRIQVGEKTFENVIIVKRIVSEASAFYQGEPVNLNTWLPEKYYYVKNVGVFSEKDAKEISNEVETNTNQSNLPSSTSETDMTKKSNQKKQSSNLIYTLLTENIWTCETGTHAGKMSYRFASSEKVYFYYFLNGKYGTTGRAEWKLHNLDGTDIIEVSGQGEFQLRKNDKGYYFESLDCKHVPFKITDSMKTELNKLETF